MLFRLASSLLLLTSLVWAQEKVVRLRPPWAGLVQNLNPTDVPDNGFTIFSNAALASTGEIYKRGGFGTVPYNTAALKIDSSYGTRDFPVSKLYRYYKTSGLKRLLALTGGLSNYDSTIYVHWYWMNDTTGRFAYTDTSLQDTFSQVSYWPSTTDSIRVDQGTGARAEYLIDRNATFFLNCSNLSDIKWNFNASDDYGKSAYGVYVVNDTILAFEAESLKAASGPDTLKKRAYQVRYRSAHTQGSTPKIFYAEAMTYLDTVYFSRGMYDPICWDGSQTRRANVVDQGAFTSIIGASGIRFRDTTKTWTVNQWAGFWGFWRRKNNFRENGNDKHRWWTNWFPISGNGVDTITIDSMVWPSTAGTDTSAYAIVSLPIDEVLWQGWLAPPNRIPGNDFIVIDTSLFNYRGQKMIYTSPIQVLITQGEGTGRRYQALAVADSASTRDTIYIKSLEHSITAGRTRVAVIRSRFPIAKFIKVFKDRTLWISDTAFQNTIYPSIPGRPGYVEPNTEIVIDPTDGEFIQAAWTDRDAVYIAKNSKIYALLVKSIETSGANPDIWQVALVSSSVGCEAPGSIVQRGTTTWFYDWPQGFYQMDGGNLDKISEPIRPLVDSITASARDRVYGVFYPSKNGDLVLWSIPLNGSTKCNRIISYSPTTKAWGTWNLTNTDSVRIASLVVEEGSGDNGELFVGLADSAYVLRYNPDANQDTLKGQGGTIRTNTFGLTMESKRFGIEGEQIRFSSIEPVLFNGGTATISFDFYKNFSSTTLGTIAPSLAAGWSNTRKSIYDAAVGNQLAWRISTSSPQSFRFGGINITIKAEGRRFNE